MIDSFNPPGIWSPFGAFSMGVIQGEGQIVYLKGQVSLDHDGHIVGKGDMQAQVQMTLVNIQTVLDSIGGTMADIVSLTQYVTDIKQFMGAGEVRKRFFVEPYPITTTVQISSLYDPNLMVEITAIAEIAQERFKRPIGKT